jgi:hypothetical protein
MPTPETIPLVTALRLIRIALGYGSRTERIQRMTHSTDPDVALTARSLQVRGFLNVEDGTLALKESSR